MILTAWLLIAPAVMILTDGADSVFVYRSAAHDGASSAQEESYTRQPTTISLLDAAEPTRLVLATLMMTYLFDRCVRRRQIPALDWPEVFMFAFGCLAAASGLLLSQRKAVGLHIAVDAFAVPFLGYFLARRFVTSDARFRRLAAALVWMGAYLIVFCLIERGAYANVLHRVSGPFEGIGAVQVIMAVAFFIALSSRFRVDEAGLKPTGPPVAIVWFAIGLAPVVVLLTLTRGNWIGFGLGVCVFLILARQWIGISRRAIVMTGLVLVGITAGVLLILPEGFVADRISNMDNLYTRIGAWVLLLRHTWEHPFFGAGLNNARAFLSENSITFMGIDSETSAHNSFLAILFDLGTVGLIMYLTILALIIRHSVRLYRTGARAADRLRAAAMLAILTAYVLPVMLTNQMYGPGLRNVYLYVLAGALAGLYGRLASAPRAGCRVDIEDG